MIRFRRGTSPAVFGSAPAVPPKPAGAGHCEVYERCPREAGHRSDPIHMQSRQRDQRRRKQSCDDDPDPFRSSQSPGKITHIRSITKIAADIFNQQAWDTAIGLGGRRARVQCPQLSEQREVRAVIESEASVHARKTCLACACVRRENILEPDALEAGSGWPQCLDCFVGRAPPPQHPFPRTHSRPTRGTGAGHGRARAPIRSRVCATRTLRSPVWTRPRNRARERLASHGAAPPVWAGVRSSRLDAGLPLYGSILGRGA